MLRSALLSITFLIALTSNAHADKESYTSTNVGGPSWDRPFADGTCCSGLGPVLYHTQTFHLSSPDTCDFNSTQAGWDGYLFVYTAPFDPLNQTVNFIAGDDDGNTGIGSSDIDGVPLAGNTDYIVVTTGFAAGDEGDFTNSISCPTADVILAGYTPPVQASVGNPTSNIALAVFLMLAALVVFRLRSRADKHI